MFDHTSASIGGQRPQTAAEKEALERSQSASADSIVAQLAYDFWEQRGCPIGSPEVDWFAAKKALAHSEATRVQGEATINSTVTPITR